MRRLSAASRISIGLTCLTMSLLLAAQGLGVLPNPIEGILRGRKQICEALAVQCSLAAQRNEFDVIQETAKAVVRRNPEILSAGLRRADGKLLVAAGDHATHWAQADRSKSTSTHVRVPILEESKQWGTLEVCFKPAVPGGAVGFFTDPIFKLIAFITVFGFIAYWVYLKKMLQYLDPSAVIPDRVKTMLNTLAEGVLVMDDKERVVLANDAFAATVGRKTSELQGMKASTLAWTQPHSDEKAEEYPWEPALRDGSMQTGIRLGLKRESDARTLRVNCSPILGGDGSRRGALATFDDITTVEEKSARLRQMLEMLQQSRDEINRQNQELQALATTDPLTGCMNRRSFFAEFEKEWSSAKRYTHPLSVVMVDVDRFKSINDRHGHSVGDQVLRHVALILKTMARDTDLVCRYGGEEFCILLSHGNIESAHQAAERFRKAIEETPCAGVSITASMGVSAIELAARDPQDMLDQADKSLYVSKRSGRNRSTRWDQVPVGVELAEKQVIEAPREDGKLPIPFHAVTALMSALAHRDASTADHCQRVADLCVATGKGLMSVQETFVLEVAAMLHDIGKLGVPDAILLKPGPLSDEEWTIMRTHDQMGVEIISAAFGSKELTEIVRTHHAWFSGNPENIGLPTGQDIPLGARILSIADAYDAMVSERPYHRPRSRETAFDELRRFAGKQFDPSLVERLIEQVLQRDIERANPNTKLPQQTALRIRLEIERLACAVEERDIAMLTAMAGHIAAVATKDGLKEIAGVAATLERSASIEKDLEGILRLTNELLALCRSPQSVNLPGPPIVAKAAITAR